MYGKGRVKWFEKHLAGLPCQMLFEAFDERSEPGKQSFPGLCPQAAKVPLHSPADFLPALNYICRTHLWQNGDFL